MGTFALDISKHVAKAKGNVDKVVRGVVMEVGKRIVDRSPVGDGSLWKNPPPKNYTGGRFRANWSHGFSVAPTAEFSDIDKSGQVSIARIVGGVGGSPVAGVHYLANNLPYAMRLETGWSRQAPGGMVGLVVQEFAGIVDDKAREVDK